MPGECDPEPPGPDALPDWATRYDAAAHAPFAWTADALVFALGAMAGGLHAITITRANEPFAGLAAWPGGFVDAHGDVDSRAAALRELREETGCADVGYMEALGTYGEIGRDPRQFAGFWDAATSRWMERGARVVSTAHLCLTRNTADAPAPLGDDDAADAAWASVYHYLPWEDLRTDAGRDAVGALREQLLHGCASEPGSRRCKDRVHRAFGSARLPWNEELVRERFELLHNAGLVAEAHRDRWGRLPDPVPRDLPGVAMAFDHRRMLADALGRLRGKTKYMPRILAALVEAPFTLDDLQHAVEAIAGRPLHRANFRRLVVAVRSALVVRTGRRRRSRGPGVDPELFIFREAVLASRLDVALRLPWLPLPNSG